MLCQFFLAAPGGPLTCCGCHLGVVHRHMGISRREFRRFTEHLMETLRKVRVREEEGSEIISYVYLSADEITNDIDDLGEAERYF